jgi:mitotic spindle assembly checkpoint protein MAD1
VAPGSGSAGAPAAVTVRQTELEASLQRAHERCAALEQELSAAATTTAAARDAVAEHARVAAEAGAAAAEAQRTGAALERVVSALEARVGRGEYNPAETKILHFRANPAALANESAAERELLTLKGECEALRETVNQLLVAQQQQQQQWQDQAWGGTPVAGGGVDSAAAAAATPGPSATPGGPTFTPLRGGFAMTPGPSVAEAELTVMRRRVADLEKREQRYMTVFKQKISTFREACYLIFGYKVDMGEDKSTGQPTFTLRSMYAARDDDALVMRVEPGKVGATGASSGGKVELLPTPYTSHPEVKMMVDTFIGRCRSVPGFVANLTMELFNTQTLA